MPWIVFRLVGGEGYAGKGTGLHRVSRSTEVISKVWRHS